MRHIQTVSGKDSLCGAIAQTEAEPGLPYERVFNLVGAELPETLEWLKRVEEVQGWKIERIGADLPRIIVHHKILPSARVRFCTREAKIEPLEGWIGDEPATVYYGLRADENRVGSGVRTARNVTARFPLVEMGINLPLVWTILERKGLLPPDFFWPRLHQRVCELLSHDPLTHLHPWQRSLFAGRSRANCYFCFYQRRYEFAWLSEAHPDLFEEAVRIEQDTGANGFSWIKGLPLPDLRLRVHDIVERRAREVAALVGQMMQGTLFGEEETELSYTSCGLLCGK